MYNVIYDVAEIKLLGNNVLQQKNMVAFLQYSHSAAKIALWYHLS